MIFIASALKHSSNAGSTNGLEEEDQPKIWNSKLRTTRRVEIAFSSLMFVFKVLLSLHFYTHSHSYQHKIQNITSKF